MKRVPWQFMILAFAVMNLPAQTALEFFTNQATSALQAQFGFGVTNIPVYCVTNPAIGYSSSVHYVLQVAADAYDATTPATNLPSVFRPQFAWQNDILYIIGYAQVTNNFFFQTSRGFKDLTDPSIMMDDNVWGIPWVVGAKGQIPAFNEYCYSSSVEVERLLFFTRRLSSPLVAITNEPPEYTNQFYIFSITNLFGAEAWNSYPQTFNRSVTLVLSNRISVTFTNGYNAATNLEFGAYTNAVFASWPGWQGFENNNSGFIVPLFTNVVSVSNMYWSETTRQFLPWPPNWAAVTFPWPPDFAQTGHPVHQWTLNITNNLMYALIDNATRQVLDFVNLGEFGSTVDIMSTLASTPGPQNMWNPYPANDTSTSPLSEGVLSQIREGIITEVLPPLFADSLIGASPCYPNDIEIFSCPYNPIAYLVQSCSWSAASPFVHYTVQDLVNPKGNQQVLQEVVPQNLATVISGGVCSLGKINSGYTDGAVNNFSYNLSNGLFQAGFVGTPNLPYAMWGSTNLIDWSQIGTVAQPSPGVFQFQDPSAGTYSNRFYQLRAP